MPIGSVRSSGEIEMDVIVGADIVTEVELETLSNIAVIIAEPAAIPLTTPVAPTVALATADEDQETSAVRSRLLPSP